MIRTDEHRKLFIARVTFERETDLLQVLPEWAQGACGWMGVKAHDEDQAKRIIGSELREIGLLLVELDNVTEISDIDVAEEYDEHLALNMRTWTQGAESVWGTIHCYAAAGEA